MVNYIPTRQKTLYQNALPNVQNPTPVTGNHRKCSSPYQWSPIDPLSPMLHPKQTIIKNVNPLTTTAAQAAHTTITAKAAATTATAHYPMQAQREDGPATPTRVGVDKVNEADMERQHCMRARSRIWDPDKHPTSSRHPTNIQPTADHQQNCHHYPPRSQRCNSRQAERRLRITTDNVQDPKSSNCGIHRDDGQAAPANSSYFNTTSVQLSTS
jgi:hypothetical protein